MLQRLYWQKEGLHDAAWRIENRIRSYARRGYNYARLLLERDSVIGEISTIESQMALIEG
jgi:hypothetical protein